QAWLSAAVWGIHTPLPGCNTSAGMRDYAQDSLAWGQAGILDALVPMSYWDMEDGSCTDWAALTQAFLAGRGQAALWMGMSATDGTFQPERIQARADYARSAGAEGVVVYASGNIDAADGWADLADIWPGAATPPGARRP